ncbi:MAG: GNAT family N-acetyltransferase [Ardenticatenales bacterium]|nr:GNAT family N-acetyltransferase [Ardenticatenales bacterium]
MWYDAGRLIANASLLRAGPDTWVIANVVTHPSYRRQGIAGRLMDSALDVARALGVPTHPAPGARHERRRQDVVHRPRLPGPSGRRRSTVCRRPPPSHLPPRTAELAPAPVPTKWP